MKQATDIRATSRVPVWVWGTLGFLMLGTTAIWQGYDAGRYSELNDSERPTAIHDNSLAATRSILPRPFPPGVNASASAQRFRNGAHLVGSANADGMVRISVDGEQLISAMAHHGLPVTAMAISSDGGTVVSGGGDSELRVWDVRAQAEPQVLRGHEHPITAVAISASGNTFASAAQETRIMLWDASTGSLRAVLSGHSDFVNDITFGSDGRLASAGADGKVLVWDTEAGAVQRTLSSADIEVNKLSFGSDGKTLVAGSADGTVVIWDASTGREQQQLTAAHRSEISALALSENGARLATASADNQVLLWDSSSGELLGSYSGPDASVTSLSFDASGNLLIGGSSGSIGQWTLEAN